MQDVTTPPWATDAEAEIVGVVQPVEAEIVEVLGDEPADEGKLHKVNKPKRGSDPADPKTVMKVMANVATRKQGGGTVADVRNGIREVGITSNIMKQLAMPCPFVPQDEKTGEVVTTSSAIARVLLSKAVAGDMAAIREVLNRSEGKVPNVTHNESKSLKVSATTDGLDALFQQLDSNRS